jgi:hypothetical protein
MIADAVFRADDGRIVHLEFQSTPEPDLYRFRGYASALATTHRAPVQVVVVYLAGRAPVSVTLDAYSIRFTVEAVVVGTRDGVAVEERLQRLANSGSAWTAADLLDLAYWPFMRHPEKTQSVRAAWAVKTAAALPRQAGLAAMALVVALTTPFLSATDVNDVQEVLRMSPLMRELTGEAEDRGRDAGREEGLQKGLVRGLQEGRQEGIQEGIRAGLKAGREEGQIRLLEIQLAQRFGSVPDTLRLRLASLSANQLEAVALRLVTADTLDAVLVELGAL